jgi:hypothetical protein
MSGAGHDAQEVSAICPTPMIFVARENNGISHTPRECSNPRACGNGTDLLANANPPAGQSSRRLSESQPRVLCFPNYQIRGLRAHMSSDSSATQSSGMRSATAKQLGVLAWLWPFIRIIADVALASDIPPAGSPLAKPR